MISQRTAAVRCIRRLLSGTANNNGSSSSRRITNIQCSMGASRAASSLAGSLSESFKDTVKASLLEHAAFSNNPHNQDALENMTLSDHQLQYWPELPPSLPTTLPDPVALTQPELSLLVDSIRQDLITTEHPVLNQAAAYFFQDKGGKMVRPMLVLLLARALQDSHRASLHGDTSPSSSSSKTLLIEPLPWQRDDLLPATRKLASVAELFHTASLLHDDVLDEADTRRQLPALHTVFGPKVAILAGDFLLARASVTLARLRNPHVVEAMSTVLEHLVLGEILQMKPETNNENNHHHEETNPRLVYYLRKNFYKTASLMALSCKSMALLGEYPDQLVDASYRFGKHVGLAFQLVDDLLDMEGSQEILGKPSGSDLRAGLATAPVLYAAAEPNTHYQTRLNEMIQRKFSQTGDVEQTMEDVLQHSNGMEQTKTLARLHAEQAVNAILELEPSPARNALVALAYKVVARTR